MKGYKGMDNDMKCRGFQFEIGKKYRVDGKVELCKNGFHFCKNLVDTFEYYAKHYKHRYFEIEASGTIKSDGKKSVAEEISIIRELGEVEISRTFYSNGDGNGYEYSYGDGYGYGYGCGNGNGDGNGYGYGYGNGYSYGYGYSCGDSNGCGDGNSYGDGNGNSYIHGYTYGYICDDGKNIQKILVFN